MTDQSSASRQRVAASPWSPARIYALLPGIAFCAAIAVAATGVQFVEEWLAGHPYVEALVIAILLGVAIRAVWQPAAILKSGIAFSAKQMLEVAIVLLGASISLQALADSGLLLIGAIVGTVVVMLGASFALGRMLGLSPKLATLVACGNAICGNSAIAAVAPVIEADPDDVASAISFTAILGVIVVVALPLVIPIFELTAHQYGILAGLSVYAVPQVLAATAPLGSPAAQIGTIVKLIRVLMLGPVVLVISLLFSRGRAPGPAGGGGIFRLVPWFIIGFLVLAALRSAGVLPASVTDPALAVSKVLTVVAMGALGLGVDVRVLATVGVRVTAAVTLSLMLLVGLGLLIVPHF